jgi:serine/threonine-protein kinase
LLADPVNAAPSAPRPVLPGATIGPYRVEGELARGGMGIVLRAVDPLLGRRVAIKLLAPDAFRERDARRRFLQEARALARVDHPNVVPVYGVGRHEDQIYIATQFVEGETLLEHVRRRGPLPVGEALAVARDVLLALEAIHACGLVHRDVKSENVMRSDDGRVKLLDFGIVKDLRSAVRLTQSNLRLGTPHYTAPEQARGERVDARTDVYSTGVVLYELLTGEIPFDGRVTRAIYEKVVRGEWPRPSERLPELSPRIDALLARFIAADPRRRFASARDAAAAVDVVLALEATPGATPRRGALARLASALSRLMGLGARRAR